MKPPDDLGVARRWLWFEVNALRDAGSQRPLYVAWLEGMQRWVAGIGDAWFYRQVNRVQAGELFVETHPVSSIGGVSKDGTAHEAAPTVARWQRLLDQFAAEELDSVTSVVGERTDADRRTVPAMVARVEVDLSSQHRHASFGAREDSVYWTVARQQPRTRRR